MENETFKRALSKVKNLPARQSTAGQFRFVSLRYTDPPLR
jgi:hypothetical protein